MRTSKVGQKIALVDSHSRQLKGTVRITGQFMLAHKNENGELVPAPGQQPLVMSAEKHGVYDLSQINDYKQIWAWQLAEVTRLEPPVAYKHLRGHQLWVKLG